MARGLTRRVLGRCLETDPRGLSFERDERGRPRLADEAQRRLLDFNISHTRGELLIATRRVEEAGERIGIDVEHVRDRVSWRALSQRFFSPADVQAIGALPADDQLEGFFTCWTRKEALVKAEGTGIAHAFGAFGVSADPDRAPTLHPTNEPPWTGAAWHLQDLPMVPGYRACVATTSPVDTVRLWTCDPSGG